MTQPAANSASRNDLLAQPLQFMKGVGPKRAELFSRLMLATVADLLYFFPIEHRDRASVTPIAKLRAGAKVNVRAKLMDASEAQTHSGKTLVRALLGDDSGTIEATWWNPYIARKFIPNAWGFFSGKVVSQKGGGRALASPEFEFLGDEEDDEAANNDPRSADFGRLVPVYSLRPRMRRPDGTEPPEVKLNQSVLRRLVSSILEMGAAERVPDELPPEVRERRHLGSLAESLRQIHFPDSWDKLEQARRRLAFEELFVLSTGVALRRLQVERVAQARPLQLTPPILQRIEARLPFPFTDAQARVFREIAADLSGARPMNRLLQGDVGSGKTAVAVASMLLAVAHKGQAVLLAPTEVLAEQHARVVTHLLGGSKVNVGLLRGGMSAGERREFLQGLAQGELHIAIGTHALLEESVVFKDLSLVVVDEQHKFGVEQRSKLRGKGRAPHVLVMTATPIPRSLSLTLYGDLDVSVIDELPPGRGEIITKWLKEADRPKAGKLILDEARKGHATYVVLPRIDGEDAAASGKLFAEVKGVEQEVKRWRELMPTLRIGMLHGRMPSEEKDQVLAALRGGKLDVLVSTLVVEVGVDLPTATIMLIENAERFGLASLHQLRGRVGRSERKSYCLFFGNPNNDEGKERLKAFQALRDGFQIAEMDFKLRGPGQFFGTEQTGLPELLVADLIRDQRLLADAREDAVALVRADPKLALPAHTGLRRKVREVVGKRLGLVDVG